MLAESISPLTASLQTLSRSSKAALEMEKLSPRRGRLTVRSWGVAYSRPARPKNSSTFIPVACSPTALTVARGPGPFLPEAAMPAHPSAVAGTPEAVTTKGPQRARSGPRGLPLSRAPGK